MNSCSGSYLSSRASVTTRIPLVGAGVANREVAGERRQRRVDVRAGAREARAALCVRRRGHHRHRVRARRSCTHTHTRPVENTGTCTSDLRGAKAGACANNNGQPGRQKAHQLMSTRRVRVRVAAAASTFVDAGIGVRGTKGSKLVLAADADEKAVAKLISFFTGCKAERKRTESRVT